MTKYHYTTNFLKLQAFDKNFFLVLREKYIFFIVKVLFLPFPLIFPQFFICALDFVHIFIHEKKTEHDERKQYPPKQNPPPGIPRDKVERVTSGNNANRARQGNHRQEITIAHRR